MGMDKQLDGRVSLRKFLYGDGLGGGMSCLSSQTGAGVAVGVPQLVQSSGMIRRIATVLARNGTSVHSLFDSLDQNRNQTLERAEIERMIYTFEPNVSPADLVGVLGAFDRDGN